MSCMLLYGVQMRETKRVRCMGAHTAQKLYAALYGHARLRPEAGVKKTVNTVSRPPWEVLGGAGVCQGVC